MRLALFILDALIIFGVALTLWLAYQMGKEKREEEKKKGGDMYQTYLYSFVFAFFYWWIRFARK